jgi:uncharacterized membrane protein
MSVTQPPSDAPFGLQPNIAAGLAYLFGIIGGIVFFVGGGTNKFVKWSAAQSITLWAVYFIICFVWFFAMSLIHLFVLLFPVMWLIDLVWFALWIWTFVTGFQGKEVRVPFIADLTQNIFKTAL